MFRKLFALEVAALASNDEPNPRTDRGDNEMLSNLREIFTPRTGDYGSMWSMRTTN